MVVDRVNAGLASVLADSGCDPSAVLGAGIGVPGVVEHEGEEALVYAQTYGWDAVPLGRLLRPAGDFPLYIDNGAKTMGQAELWFGGGRGARQVVVCLMGSGLGASIVTGAPRPGRHAPPRSSGGTPRSRWAGDPAAAAPAAAWRRTWAPGRSWTGTGSSLPGEDEESALAALVAAGDARSAEILDETALYLGAGIADLVNLFGPERIILGGWAGLLLGERAAARHPRGGQAALADPPVRPDLDRARQAGPGRGGAGRRHAPDGALPRRRDGRQGGGSRRRLRKNARAKLNLGLVRSVSLRIMRVNSSLRLTRGACMTQPSSPPRAARRALRLIVAAVTLGGMALAVPAQASGMWWQVNLGSAQSFDQIEMDSGGYAGDYAHGYEVEVSSDGTNFTTVSTGTGTANPVTATFTTQTAQYIRVQLTTGVSTNWWSMVNFTAYTSGSASFSWTVNAASSGGGGTSGQLPETGWTASSNTSSPAGDAPQNAISGNAGAASAPTPHQAPGMWFQVNMGSAQTFNQVVMNSGGQHRRLRRRLRRRGLQRRHQLHPGLLRHRHHRAAETATFSPQTAQYIRILLTASSTGSWWSMTSFTAYNTPGPRRPRPPPRPAAASARTCTCSPRAMSAELDPEHA